MRHVLDVGDAHHPGAVEGDVGEHPVEVHVLLGAGVDQVVEVVAGDGEHRLAVELGVVEAVQEVQPAGAAGGQADAEFAGELGVPAGHERRGLLVPDVDEPHLVLAGP